MPIIDDIRVDRELLETIALQERGVSSTLDIDTRIVQRETTDISESTRIVRVDDVDVTEDLRLISRDSESFSESMYIPKGRDGAVAVYTNGKELKAFTNIKAKKRLNEMDSFEFEAYIEDNEDRQLVQEGNSVEIFEDRDNLLFKGRFEKVKYKSSFRAKCEGYGQEVKLLNRKTKRTEYNNTTGHEIVEELVTSDVMSEGTIDDAPVTSVRFDHDNRLRAIASVANAVGYDWYVSQKRSDGFDADYLNFVESAGDDDPVETFEIGSTARMVEREKDTEHIANDITMLGRGDGINQLEARVFAATTHRTVTAERLDEDDNDNLDVKDASQLGDDGDEVDVRVGTEVINGTLDTSNDQIDISERGLDDYEGNSTDEITHAKDIQVFLKENKTQDIGPFEPTSEDAEDGSSIEVYGVREEKETDRTIISDTTLEKAADNELKNRYEDIFRIQVQPSDPRATRNVELGDTVEVKDVTAMDVDDEFRVVGIDVKRASSDEGTTLHLANRPLRLTERLRDIKRETDTTSTHMQGATNFNGEHFEDNADEDHPLTNKIYVPNDVVAVNKFELTFARESFRGYTESTEEESEHTHDVELNPEVDGERFLSHSHDFSFDDSIGTHAASVQVIVPDGNDQELTVQHSDTQVGNFFVDAPSPTGFDESDIDEWLITIEIANFGDSSDTFEWEVDEEDESFAIIDDSASIGSNTVHVETYTVNSDYIDTGETLTYRPQGGEFDHSNNRDATSKKSYVRMSVLPRAEMTEDSTSETSLDSQRTETSKSGSAHSHGVNYGLFEPDDEPDVDIEVIVDGNTVETVEDVSVGQEVTDPIDLKPHLDEPIEGEYHTIELKPVETDGGNGGRCRIAADITQKVFIESKL